MKWLFGTEVTGEETIVITCEGALTLSGDLEPEILASAEPTDVVEEDDEIRLAFADDTEVLVPEDVAAVRIEQSKGRLEARRLKCGLDVKLVNGDARIRDHEGGLTFGQAACSVHVSGLSGGLTIGSVGGECRLKSINGGIGIENCVGDLRVSGLSGGLSVELCQSDAKISAISGGIAVEAVKGDLNLGAVSGGVDVQSVSGDVALGPISGGIDLDHAGGDVKVASVSGGLRVGGVSGECTIAAVSGRLQVERVGGGLAVGAVSGETQVGRVGGDLRVRKAEGKLSVARVAGEVTIENAELEHAAVTASGDISLSGEIAEGGRCELVSDEGSVSVALPEDCGPVLAGSEAGGEVICDIPEAEEGCGPRLVLRAAGNIRISALQIKRRSRRRARRRVSRRGPSAEELREERLMVLKMVEAGKVTAEDGARLLEALADD